MAKLTTDDSLKSLRKYSRLARRWLASGTDIPQQELVKLLAGLAVAANYLDEQITMGYDLPKPWREMDTCGPCCMCVGPADEVLCKTWDFRGGAC
jgi:hypothetical protein